MIPQLRKGILLLSLGCMSMLQAQSFEEQLHSNYGEFKENSLTHRRFKHKDLQPLLARAKAHPMFEVKQVGTSIQGRSISMISFGEGDTDVLLWSQMHGDESTATMALFDLLNFFTSDSFKEEKQAVLKNLRVHFIPMLNPDGAEVFERRNALGVDMNRDAISLQSPESKVLKAVRDSLEADFGFNLHDQSTYYNADRTSKPATISFLAPAYNYEKEVNEVRARAMQLIVHMNALLQEFSPGQVGRYNDDFEPRAFGDNIQRWGTSTVLIESGGYPGDPEKQEIRKLNFVILASALKCIAEKQYEDIEREAYFSIPNNDRKLFDLKITNLKYPLLGSTYNLDLGLHRYEQDGNGNPEFYYTSSISDQGDLSTYFGYQELDASAFEVVPAMVSKEVYTTARLAGINPLDLLKKGVGFVQVSDLPKDKKYFNAPLHLVAPGFKYDLNFKPGVNPTFFLKKDGQFAYAVINGFMIDLQSKEVPAKVNGLQMR